MEEAGYDIIVLIVRIISQTRLFEGADFII
jgi:hypothetical protein